MQRKNEENEDQKTGFYADRAISGDCNYCGVDIVVVAGSSGCARGCKKGPVHE